MSILSSVANAFGTTKPSRPDYTPEVQTWADSLRSALLTSAKKDDNGQVVGINLGNSENFKKEVDGLVSDLSSTYTTYRKQIDKYKKIEDMNKLLVPQFKNSMTIIVDVSNLLNIYVDLFKQLQAQIKQFSTIVGKEDEQLTNVAYLQDLTTDKIKQLQESLIKQQQFFTKFNDEIKTPESQRLKDEFGTILTNNTGISTQADLATKLQGGKGPKKSAKALKRKVK